MPIAPRPPTSRRARPRSSGNVGRLLRGDDAAPTLTLETKIRFAGAEERVAFARELQEAIAVLVSRYHDSADDGRAFTVLDVAHPEAT